MKEKFEPKKISKTEQEKQQKAIVKFLSELLADMGPYMEVLKNLPKEAQDDIFADIVDKAMSGMVREDIVNRLCASTKGYQEFLKINESDSDLIHKPKISKAEIEKKEIDEALAKAVNKFLYKIERK